MKKKAPRRPRDYCDSFIGISHMRSDRIYFGTQYLTAKEARKLAAWLNRAATYLEHKRREK